MKTWLDIFKITGNNEQIKYPRDFQQLSLDLISLFIFPIKHECHQELKSEINLTRSIFTKNMKKSAAPAASTEDFTD